MLNGKEFRFSVSNNYYFHYRSNKMIDDVMDNASKMIKSNALLGAFYRWYWREQNKRTKIEMQPRIGEYAESGFERFRSAGAIKSE